MAKETIWHVPYSAEQIQAAIGKEPKINEDTNTWMVWDVEQKAYVDTGVSAIGPEGEQGPQGEVGPAPDIQVGTVTTLPAGSDATVTRDPDSSDDAPVFDFGIPKGADGEGGDMMKSVYDPQNKEQDIFAYADGKVNALKQTVDANYANVLKPATKTEMGLPATAEPDDAFQQLSLLKAGFNKYIEAPKLYKLLNSNDGTSFSYDSSKLRTSAPSYYVGIKNVLYDPNTNMYKAYGATNSLGSGSFAILKQVLGQWFTIDSSASLPSLMYPNSVGSSSVQGYPVSPKSTARSIIATDTSISTTLFSKNHSEDKFVENGKTYYKVPSVPNNELNGVKAISYVGDGSFTLTIPLGVVPKLIFITDIFASYRGVTITPYMCGTVVEYGNSLYMFSLDIDEDMNMTLKGDMSSTINVNNIQYYAYILY